MAVDGGYISVDVTEFLDMRAELKRVKAELARVSKALIEANSNLNEARQENSSLRRNSQTQRRFEAEIANLVRDRRIANEKYAILLERCKNLEAELAKPNVQLEILQNRLVETRTLLEREQQRAAATGQSLADAESRARNNLLARSAAEKVMERIRQEKNQLQREMEILRRQISAGDLRIRELTAELERSRKNNAELAAAIKAGDSGHAAAVAGHNAETSRLRDEISARNSKIAELEKQNLQLDRMATQLRQQLQDAREQLSAMKGEFERGSAALKNSMAEATDLRRRNAEMDADLKQLSAQVATLSRRLETRDSEDFRNASAARETCRKLERDLVTLQNELVELRNRAVNGENTIADLQRQLKSAQADLQSVRRQESLVRAENQQLSTRLASAAETQRQLAQLQSNFDALARENRENRALLAAAKPRERELARVKLRLLELDRLKASLVREQQLNEELRRETRRLAGEVKLLRKRSAELDEARRKITELEGLNAELQRLRQMQQEYRRLSALESQFAALKIHSGELETAIRERQAQIDALKQLLETAGKNRADLEKQLAALNGVRRRNQELDAMVTSLNQEVQNLNAMLAKFKAGDPGVMPAEYRRQIAELRKNLSRIGPLNDRIARLQQELQQTKEQFQHRINLLISRCSTAESLASRRADENSRLRKLNEELAKMNSNITSALQSRVERAQFDRLGSELEALKQLYSAVTAERDRLVTELDALRRGVAPELSGEKIAESPEQLSADGLQAERNGNIQLAIWNYSQALRASAEFRPAHLRLAHIYFKRKDYARALPHLSAARVDVPDDLELALKTALCYIRLKRFGNAKTIIDPLLRTRAENYQVQLLAGLIEAESGSFSNAEERLVTAGRLAPQQPEVFIELARLLANSVSDRQGEAVAAYERARALGAAPVPDLEKKLGKLLDNRREIIRFYAAAASEAELNREFGSAVWYYRKLVEIKPAEFVPRLALALHRNGKSAQARETLEFNTPSRAGMMVLAIIETDAGNDTAAIRAARQCSGVKIPDDWQAMTMEISRLRKLPRPTAAVRLLLSSGQK